MAATASPDTDARHELSSNQQQLLERHERRCEGVLFLRRCRARCRNDTQDHTFAENFKKRIRQLPVLLRLYAYDEVYYIADAVHRAGSTDADKLVDALETTDWEGTIGRVQFYGKDAATTHSLKVGPGLVAGLMSQWQNGKQVTLWPAAVASGKISFPSFIKIGAK